MGVPMVEWVHWQLSGTLSRVAGSSPFWHWWDFCPSWGKANNSEGSNHGEAALINPDHWATRSQPAQRERGAYTRLPPMLSDTVCWPQTHLQTACIMNLNGKKRGPTNYLSSSYKEYSFAIIILVSFFLSIFCQNRKFQDRLPIMIKVCVFCVLRLIDYMRSLGPCMLPQ